MTTTTEEKQPTKVCCKCVADKPLSEFSKRIGSSDGKQSICIECNRKYQVIRTQKKQAERNLFY